MCVCVCVCVLFFLTFSILVSSKDGVVYTIVCGVLLGGGGGGGGGGRKRTETFHGCNEMSRYPYRTLVLCNFVVFSEIIPSGP